MKATLKKAVGGGAQNTHRRSKGKFIQRSAISLAACVSRFVRGNLHQNVPRFTPFIPHATLPHHRFQRWSSSDLGLSHVLLEGRGFSPAIFVSVRGH